MAKAHTFTLTKFGEQVSCSKDPAAVVETLRNGRYTVTITREREPRTLDQNSLMWLWFTCISEETGTPVQDVHDHYCATFLRKEIDWNGTQQIVTEGTRKLSKQRMTTFLDQVQADALTEFGIRLPNPDDRSFNDFYQTYK